MGIKGGYELLSRCGQEITVSDMKGITLAIDMMTYVVRFYKIYASSDTSKGFKKWYKKVLEFIHNLIKNDIICICVFDGYNKPPEKKTYIQKTRKFEGFLKPVGILSDLDLLDKGKTEILQQRYPNKTLSEIDEIIAKNLKCCRSNLFPSKEELKNLMILIQSTFNCDVYVAGGEAENLCSYLVKTGKATHVLSEDSDVLLYKTNNFIMKFDGKQGKLYSLENILLYHNLTFDEIFCLSLLLGTDYDKGGVSGYGFQRGMKLIKQNGLKIAEQKIPNIQRMKEIFIPSPEGWLITYSKDELKTAIKSLL